MLNSPTRLLLVDDHPVILEGLQRFLKAEPELSVAATAGCGVDALKRANPRHIDVVLMDINLPDGNGIETMRRIYERWPSSKVILMTGHKARYNEGEISSAGAWAFLSKDAELEEIVWTIQAVRRGNKCIDEKPEQVECTADKLSEREREVLTLIATGHTIRQIAEQLGLGQRTVETYRERLVKKLGVSSVAGMVGLVPQGLVLLVGIALAVGIVRLSRNHGLVQELHAVEGLAAS